MDVAVGTAALALWLVSCIDAHIREAAAGDGFDGEQEESAVALLLNVLSSLVVSSNRTDLDIMSAAAAAAEDAIELRP